MNEIYLLTNDGYAVSTEFEYYANSEANLIELLIYIKKRYYNEVIDRSTIQINKDKNSISYKWAWDDDLDDWDDSICHFRVIKQYK